MNKKISEKDGSKWVFCHLLMLTFLDEDHKENGNVYTNMEMQGITVF